MPIRIMNEEGLLPSLRPCVSRSFLPRKIHRAALQNLREERDCLQSTFGSKILRNAKEFFLLHLAVFKRNNVCQKYYQYEVFLLIIVFSSCLLLSVTSNYTCMNGSHFCSFSEVLAFNSVYFSYHNSAIEGICLNTI